MASEDIKATEWTCDGCDRRVVMAEFEGPPNGFHGNVYEVGEWGCNADVTWWACRRSCIRKAVLAALAREEARD